MTPGVRQRFVFTVTSNLLRSLFSFTASMLLARWLGPSSFGTMTFLLGTFLALRSLMELGSSSAFFTFMSQRTRSRAFVRGYYGWLLLQFVLAATVIGVVLPAPWVESIWRGEPRAVVMLAFVASFMQDNVWAVLQQAAESQRQTLKVQRFGVVIMGAHLSAILLLRHLSALKMEAVFVLLALEYGAAAVVAHRVCIAPFLKPHENDVTGTQGILRAFSLYCTPFVPYAFIGFGYAFADRWLLQRFGGSVQQAYYSVGGQFANVALLATSSILQILWKEVAEAHHSGNRARMQLLYERIARVMFFISAAVSGFLIPWSRDLLHLVLGATYAAGTTTLAIMFLYPVHQSLGQVNVTTLYATENARPQVLAGTVMMAVSILVTYVVLAGRTAMVPGLGMGSVGLALKMVGLQLVYVNVLGYIIARRFGWRFRWFYQPVLLAACLCLGFLSRSLAVACTAREWPLQMTLVLSGVPYVAFLAGLIFALPGQIGLSRSDLLPEARLFFRQTMGLLRPK